MKFFVLSALFGIAASSALAQDVSEMNGTWSSIACEVRPQPNQDGTMGSWWLTREVTMAPGRIDAVFTTYAGPGCGFALQELHFGGRVDVVGPSTVIEGGVEANLTIDDYVRIKPLAQGFADFLNSAPEGACLSPDWAVGTAREILADGCLVLGVQPNTPTVEYEVLAVRGDMIHFGARPTDGSFIVSPEKRPQALLVGAARVND